MYYIVGLRDTLRECLDYASVLLDSPKMNNPFNYSTHNLTSSLSDMADSGVPGDSLLKLINAPRPVY